MLDPFTALSLAGNILQFVNLGHMVLVTSLEIYRSGTIEGNRQLEIVTRDLTALSNRIDKEEPQRSTSSSTSSTEDQALQDLARETLAVSQELLDVLARIKVANERSRFNSLRQALRHTVNEDKIHELEQRLVTLRSELSLRVLVSLRNSSAAQAIKHDSRLDSLGADLQTTIREILDGNAALLSGKIDQSTATLARQQQNHHNEILEALSGISCSPGTPSQRIQAVQSPQLTEEKAKQTEDFILQQLAFREISDRADSIDRAHESTFKWIFDEDTRPDENWSNFAEWLRGNNSIYWVRGKAGSGKSTLMKYLSASERTAEILQMWAGDSTLHIAAFHFWNLGTALQRSQSGLLRALLLSLLANHRYLLKTSMPGYYTDVSKMLASDMWASALEPLSDMEVKAAFIKAVKALPSNTHACIFIDGLDEYEGDVPGILDLLLPIASEKFKMVISSRPIPSCLSAFQNYPQLRLEDLTRPDILSYTKQRLESHPNARRLKQYYKAGLDALIEKVVHKSSGVFLWVALVVKVLLRCLDAGDKMEELTQQLDALPTELGPFYKHMMDRMETSYRKQASWYLQIVLRSVEVQLEHPLDLIQCFLAEFYAETSAFPESDPDLIDPGSSFWEESCLLMEHRLISRCCGLVEALDHGARGGPRTVAFIHKSVADFLRQPDIWEYIVDLTKDEKNDINFVLGRSRVLHTRIMWPKPWRRTIFSSGLIINIRYCLKYLREGESSARRTSLRTLQDLSRYTSLWAHTGDDYINCEPVPSAHARSYGPSPQFLPPVGLDRLSNPQADMYIAAGAGLRLHFRLFHANRTTRSLQGGRSSSTEDDQLLVSLLKRRRLELACKEGFLNERLEMVQVLVENGSDPNWKTGDPSSAWELLLRNLVFYSRPGKKRGILSRSDDWILKAAHEGLDPTSDIISALLDLIPVFLRHAKDVRTFKVPVNTTAGAKRLALATVEQVITYTSPADGKLYLKLNQVQKMLLDTSENKNPNLPGRRGHRSVDSSQMS